MHVLHTTERSRCSGELDKKGNKPHKIQGSREVLLIGLNLEINQLQFLMIRCDF